MEIDVRTRLIGTGFAALPQVGDRVFLGLHSLEGRRRHPVEVEIVELNPDFVAPLGMRACSFGPLARVRTADGDTLLAFVDTLYATDVLAAKTFRDPPRLETVVRFGGA
jgi:hypothetical protein